MVKENILEFEKRHSKNLIELNEWVEKVKLEEGKKPQTTEEVPVTEKDEEVPWEGVVFLENSELYKECGTMWNCDPLYEKLNKANLHDISYLKMLKKYLTDEELGNRLTFENRMLLETEKVIDDFVNRKEDKKIRKEINILEDRVRELKKTLRTETLDDKVNKIVDDLAFYNELINE